MLAKGRLLGIHFETLFTGNLYLDISKNAIGLAMRIREAFADKGYHFFNDSKTNQQFVLMDDDTLNRLSTDFMFARWGKTDEGYNIVRICTSWATTEENADKLIASI